jgi:hypothetical protein
MPGVDVFDADRDARTWAGGVPVVAHPPCRAWGRLRTFAKPRPDEKALAFFAIAQVRAFGGVLEHPAGSTLWQAAGLPMPGRGRDAFGGWTLGINQSDFGHRAEKATMLYIVGLDHEQLPPMPRLSLAYATHCIETRAKRGTVAWRPSVTKAEREHTPAPLAAWLVEVARLARLAVSRG